MNESSNPVSDFNPPSQSDKRNEMNDDVHSEEMDLDEIDFKP